MFNPVLICFVQYSGLFGCYPPASEASREVANLTERKNPHTPVYGVKEFVCLSVIIHLYLIGQLLGLFSIASLVRPFE